MVKSTKFITVFLFILLLGVITYGYFRLRSRSFVQSDSRIAVPAQTALFLEINDLPGLMHEIDTGNNIWLEICKIRQMQKLKYGFHFLDSLLRTDNQIKGLLSGKLTVAVCSKSNKTPGIMYIVPAGIKNQRVIILELFKRHTGKFNYSIRKFESVNVYDLNWSGSSGPKNFSFTVIRGLVIGSSSGELVETSIQQIREGKSIISMEEFKEVTRTVSEKIPVSLFIQYRNLPGLARFLSSGKGILRSNQLEKFADWSEFDMEIFSDKIILNGFADLNDTVFRQLNFINDQDPVEFESPSILPASADLFKLYGISDKDKLFSQISRKLKSDEALKVYIQKKEELKARFEIDLDSSIRDLMANEYGISISREKGTTHRYFIVKLRSQGIAEDIFTQWIGNYAAKNGIGKERFLFVARMDNTTSIPVYHLPLGGIPAMVFGDEFDMVMNDYFTFINNYIVFSNSPESLKLFLYQVILGNTISMDPLYKSLNENISSLSNYFIFLKPGRVAEYLVPFLNDQLSGITRASGSTISKFNAFSLQFTGAGHLVYGRIFINFSGNSRDNISTVWESRLDTITRFKPAIVLNHNTGEKEILIQDSHHQVYLLSNAGLVLWKQRLDGPILSDIFQVDYYRNKKLQYLFNTSEKIYLIDRNGNPVDKYPVNMRSPATAGLNVFDYDRSGNIRICIPSGDRNIYMYDKGGKIIPGWRFGKTDQEVNRPVQHFRDGTKDYLVAIDKFKFYILDRQGNIRIRPSKYFPVSGKNSFYMDNTRGGTRGLVTTDTAGNIMKINLNGRVIRILEQKLDPGHFFTLADLDGDKINEFIFTSGNEFFVINQKGEKRFSHLLSSEIRIKPQLYNFGAGDTRVGIVLEDQGNLYLYKHDGSLYNGFPLEGTGSFSISSFPELNGKFNLIVGGRHNFLYNYLVQ